MTDSKLILNDLKLGLLEKYSGSLNNVILFGSQASNKATEYSDYDILILLNEDYSRQDEDTILDICYEIDLKYNILIDAHLLSTNELMTLRGKQPVFLNAIKNGMYAWRWMIKIDWI